ncbi:16S rRNA (guanine(527)-N(7))-methyltransferase RsmG [Paenibacillus aceris]|uniref:Ribosomal RNA small subunit methyltransferase G n=1 Tax=Paenibacillus aceris TaxID=869555 RepID=A0ABS4I053_9BACL|nr:16S rRNA (guanine(527)-N(7))-methyltransferase RsmG [Paenibacillus aceris]MBP1963801.1 16S rRNA (guanine527-N7)-methyltransferase [Paenibacillus aceris]NHW34776.1 16S rRNA (guanine(527)-N(7))-methyltransferase RsmG [Paenibacillus aceris]
MDATQQQFVQLLEKQNISLCTLQLDQFEQYYKTLVEWNEKMNLTGITEREQVYLKHFYDSLSVAFNFDVGSVSTIADIGSGAGFPSIPLKIAFPHLKVTIVDSLNKRIIFLKELVSQLGLSDTECVHGRAEDIARLPKYRDQFDLATARAVARLQVLNEFCLPFVKKDGTFIAMKGSEIEEELSDSSFSLTELKGKVVRVLKMQLPIEESLRHFVEIHKLAATPAKYPRKAGIPLKEPLMKL